MRASANRLRQVLLQLLAIGCSGLHLSLPAVSRSKDPPIAAKWSRFEQTFKSSFSYLNALQDATLTVVFTSPSGDTRSADGFWDGGKTWRVRFSPDQLGRWTFHSLCSDRANRGLHDQTGEFVCIATTGQSRFDLHGPVGLARDNRHFEHADGTPFFWLADTVWNGARISEAKDWEFYARTRAAQQFSVAQWAVAPGPDVKGEFALTRSREVVAINPGVFQRLDSKLDALARSGILSAVAPLLDLASDQPAHTPMTDDQAALFVRYVIARWGAAPVVWVLAFPGESQARNTENWKRIGRAGFARSTHAPVLLETGGEPRLLDEFRDEAWVSAFGCQPVTDFTDDDLRLTFAGPVAKVWSMQPTRPIVLSAPSENAVGLQSKKRFRADSVRQAMYWSQLLASPAGVSYGAQGVMDWDTTGGGNRSAGKEERQADLPMWQKALFMPAAKQMSVLASFVHSMDFWRLRPSPQLVAEQQGTATPHRHVAAAATESKDLVVVYVPEDRSVELMLEALQPSPDITWFNPRTGQNSPAVGVIGARTGQFPTPATGDWLLIMKVGK